MPQERQPHPKAALLQGKCRYQPTSSRRCLDRTGGVRVATHSHADEARPTLIHRLGRDRPALSHRSGATGCLRNGKEAPTIPPSHEANAGCAAAHARPERPRSRTEVSSAGRGTWVAGATVGAARRRVRRRRKRPGLLGAARTRNATLGRKAHADGLLQWPAQAPRRSAMGGNRCAVPANRTDPVDPPASCGEGRGKR